MRHQFDISNLPAGMRRVLLTSVALVALLSACEEPEPTHVLSLQEELQNLRAESQAMRRASGLPQRRDATGYKQATADSLSREEIDRLRSGGMKAWRQGYIERSRHYFARLREEDPAMYAEQERRTLEQYGLTFQEYIEGVPLRKPLPPLPYPNSDQHK